MKTTRPVTEADLRAPECREGTPADYEWRDDGKIVRRDRWERGIREIADALKMSQSFEIADVVAHVVAMRDRTSQLLDLLGRSPDLVIRDAAIRVCELIDSDPGVAATQPEDVREMWRRLANEPGEKGREG